MNKITFILFGLAVAFGLVSCEKADPAGKFISISAEYNNSESKTAIVDGHTVWTEGDVIKVIGNKGDVQTVELDASMIIEGRTAKFQVKSESTILYAVYPAAIEATLNGEKLSVVIPEIQDGSFASANICVAKGAVIDQKVSLAFKNATGIFKFKQPETGEKIEFMTFVADPIIQWKNPAVVVGKNSICGNIDITFAENSITVTPQKKAFQGHSISVKGCKDMNEWYIAAAPGNQEHIDVIYMTTQGNDGKGCMFPYGINNFTVQVNHIQPVKTHTFSSGDNYLFFDLGNGIKCAYYNIGSARKNTDYSKYNSIGNFYSWGQPTTLKLFTKYDEPLDIATANWGEDWRMPTKEEMQLIIHSTGTQISYSGNNLELNKWHTFKGSLSYSNISDMRQSEQLPIGGYAQNETTWYGKHPGDNTVNNGKMWYWTSEKSNGVPVFMQIDLTVASATQKTIAWYTGSYEDRTLNGMLVRPIYDPKK